MPEAWLVTVKDGGPLSDFDRLTLRQAVPIVALELLRGRVAGDTESRLAGDVLAGVVSGELAGPELARRLTPFGLGERIAAIVVRRPADERGQRGAAAARAVEDALHQALRENAVGCLVASTDALTCALVAGSDEPELFGLAESVTARLPGSAPWPPARRRRTSGGRGRGPAQFSRGALRRRGGGLRGLR